MSLFVGLSVLGIVFFIAAIILYRSFPGVAPKTIRRIVYFGVLLIIAGVVLCIYRPKGLGRYLNPPSDNTATSPTTETAAASIEDTNSENETIALNIIVRHGKILINKKDFGSLEALGDYLRYYDGSSLSITLVDDYASSKTYHDTYDYLNAMENVSIDSEIPIESLSNEE